jgi:hypothetical protein
VSAEVLQKSLEILQFVDNHHEHPWNDFQMERQFGDQDALLVWARRWPQIKVQWEQQETIELACTEDIDVVVRVVMMAIAFLTQLGTANASPAPEPSAPEATKE